MWLDRCGIYSNPHQILEYLFDLCTVLKIKPVVLEKFPYMGVAGQGDVNEDVIFDPFERSKDLADALVKEVQRRDNQEKL